MHAQNIDDGHKTDDGGRSVSQGGSSIGRMEKGRIRGRPKISARPNYNLHPKTDRSQQSSRFFADLTLDCLNKTKIKDYDVQCLIGQGSFGVVQRATYKPTG